MSEQNRRRRLNQIQAWITESKNKNEGKFTDLQEQQIIRQSMLVQGISRVKVLEYLDLIFDRNARTHQGDEI